MHTLNLCLSGMVGFASFSVPPVWLSTCVHVSVCGSAQASPFLLLPFPDTFQLPALFTASSGFPSHCLGSHGQAACPGPCPVAFVTDLTLRVILSGNPLECNLPGLGWREVMVEERDKAGKGASWQHLHLLLETRHLSGPLTNPFFSVLSHSPSIHCPRLAPLWV